MNEGMTHPKIVLHRYLRDARDALVWKLDGLDERAARMPRTPTGTNLLGILKHCLNVEAGYFGPAFGRTFPHSDRLVTDQEYDDDPQADWYAREDEPQAVLIGLYRQVWDFADQTIRDLPLDAHGQVPWWPPNQQQVTLHQVITHVTYDLARHAGQADIIREHLDRLAGFQPGNTNIPGDYDWPAYTAKLTTLASRFQ